VQCVHCIRCSLCQITLASCYYLFALRYKIPKWLKAVVKNKWVEWLILWLYIWCSIIIIINIITGCIKCMRCRLLLLMCTVSCLSVQSVHQSVTAAQLALLGDLNRFMLFTPLIAHISNVLVACVEIYGATEICSSGKRFSEDICSHRGSNMNLLAVYVYT